MRHYYVYILTNKQNKVLYIGVTNNLLRRVWQHKSKIIKGFTEKYNIDKLVFFKSFDNPNDAINAEKKMKGWIRNKKVELIQSTNPNWEDLYSKIDPSQSSG